jgi:hypothetical protein
VTDRHLAHIPEWGSRSHQLFINHPPSIWTLPVRRGTLAMNYFPVWGSWITAGAVGLSPWLAVLMVGGSAGLWLACSGRFGRVRLPRGRNGCETNWLLRSRQCEGSAPKAAARPPSSGPPDRQPTALAAVAYPVLPHSKDCGEAAGLPYASHPAWRSPRAFWV